MDGENNKGEFRVSSNLDNGFSELLYQMMFVPKPFGMVWKYDNMIDFLKFKGYKVIERIDEETGRTNDVAVKSGAKYIPDATKSNILEVFEDELQKTLLNWLKKISE